MKKILKNLLRIPNNFYNYIVLKFRNVRYGKKFTIYGKLFCVSNSKNSIIIGDNVTINSCLSSNPIGGDTRTILFAKKGGKIYIGNGCGISNATLFATESIVLEDNVYIGGSTHIYDTDFHWLDFDKRMNECGGKQTYCNKIWGIYRC